MTDLTAIVRPTFQTPATPSAVSPPVPSAAEPTLITEQQLLFSTAAAVALPRVKPRRWVIAIKSVSGAMSALFTDPRPPAKRYTPRRYMYLENGVMAREMHRL
ncbi:hypothetical protein AB4Z42_16530 [Mycobacterium sp. 2YAF39]|uniref:hypothetical protein n=1 Tax=Mycobacterium sp. 2YAF39 TaxID=3233033 RepID=UPI003F94DAA4